jgi:stearoyl-CoA desaturase (delta-9 desaturase)
MFKLKPASPMDNVQDLKKDALVMWQDKWVHGIAFFMSFILPSIIGYVYAVTTGNLSPMAGALGGFLIPGVARVVMVQHATFCINSLCHMIGERPYSTSHSARDSWIAAIFTMGEGYHNYHHEFQWDYRNGVKPWQLDPSKWIIWFLSKFGLTGDLKRVPNERLLLAETRETRRQLYDQISNLHQLSNSSGELIEQTLTSLENWSERLTEICDELQKAVHDKLELSKSKLSQLRTEIENAISVMESNLKIAVA